MTADERPRIALLPPAVAARIAAGEVIERPASIVKELVENALDAGAGRITVELDAGGIERLRVRDDGCGIPPDQLADAFERHATSKLRSEHDLFAVRTLGFRGEALAAIAAAADVDLTTRPAGHDAAAVARMRDGRLAHQGSAAAAPGTTVDVRDLFAALPARLKFLRSPQAEARAVAQVVSDYALAYPDVAFSLIADGRTIVQSPGDGDPVAAVAAIHGADVAGRLLALRGERTADADGGDDRQPDGAAPPGEPPVRATVHGLIGPPDLHRANRSYIHLFAGGRAIASRTLTHAIEQGYAGLIPAGRHPVAIVHIDVPAEQVDVNVHPRKAEVRFRHERLVYGALAAAVRDALAGAAPPAGSDAAFAPLPNRPERWSESPWTAEHAARGRDVVAGARPAPMLTHDSFAASAPDEAALAELVARLDVDARREPDTAPPAPQPVGAEPNGAGPETDRPAPSRLGALRALGQVALTYIVAEGDDGLVLIDQHAAHERVLYERVRAARAAGTPAGQPLLAPAIVELSPAQAALVAELMDELAAVGWSLEPADGRAVLLRALPAALARHEPERALREQLDRLDAEERLTGPDRVAASLACRAAVMAGDRLEEAQQRALLRALEATATPQTCPHGRPTALRFTREALERSFARR